VSPAARTVRADSWATRADAAQDCAELCHSRRDWIGVLASVDRERRARIQAAEFYTDAARLCRAIGDLDGARHYAAAASWERELAATL
jgi:hypothetical protein